MAMRLNIDFLLCLQNVYIVNGNPGLSAKLCISLANRSGVFDGGIIFAETGAGDDLSVTAIGPRRNQIRLQCSDCRLRA